MTLRTIGLAALTAAAGLLAAGCANDGTLQTAAISTTKQADMRSASTVDPACVALSNQIEILRKDDKVGGLEKAATGKSASVKVKRDALAKQAELNRVNADFQTKCGPKMPAAQAAQAAPAPATTAGTQQAAATPPKADTAAATAQVAPVATTTAKAAAATAAKP
ncbi:MAG: hypothetical protein ABL907_16305 [Hyphomicrobium sp.]